MKHFSVKNYKALSKINLYLEIAGKRKDGYHEIQTFFYPLSNPHDLINIELNSNKKLIFKADTDELPNNYENLCIKAAQKFAEYAGIIPSWNITLEKRIPVAAGLGGGSSDAAAVLKILNSHYKALSSNTLKKAALEIGADVPYFLKAMPAYAEGIGDKLNYINAAGNNIPVLIAAPNFPVSAAWAYRNFKENPEVKNISGLHTLINGIKSENISYIAENIRNDLAFSIEKKFPVLKILKEELCHSGACECEISGSGPTLFALYKNNRDLEKAANLRTLRNLPIKLYANFAKKDKGI